jgi:hypothetical protein
LLHSHLFLHDQLTFADISGTDTNRQALMDAATQKAVADTNGGFEGAKPLALDYSNGR